MSDGISQKEEPLGCLLIIKKAVRFIVLFIAVVFIVWIIGYKIEGIINPLYERKCVNAGMDEAQILEECPEIQFADDDEEFFRRILASGIIDSIDLDESTLINGEKAAKLLDLDSTLYSKAEIFFENSYDEQVIDTEYTKGSVYIDSYTITVLLYGKDPDYYPVCKLKENRHDEYDSQFEDDCSFRSKQLFKDFLPFELKKGRILDHFRDNHGFPENYELTEYWNLNGEYYKYDVRIVRIH